MIGKIPSTARPWLITSVLFSVLVICSLVGQYWLAVRPLDRGFHKYYLFIFAAFAVFRFILLAFQRRISAQTAMAVKKHYRSSLLEKLEVVHPDSMTPERRGKLNYLFGEGIEVLDLYWGLFVPQFFTGLIGPLAVCVMIIIIDPLAGIVLSLLIPLIPGILMVVFRRFSSVSKMYQANLAALTEQFTQSLYGLPLLKLYQASKEWGRVIRNQSAKLRNSTMDLLKTNQLVILLVDLLFSLGTMTAASLLSLWHLQSGKISIADSGFIILSSIELIRPLSLMGAFFFAGALGREVQKDMVSFLSLDEIVRPSVAALPEGCLIQVRDLAFSYPSKPPLFERFSAELREGEVLCIAGTSGVGKSTLIKLINGILRPDEGEILLAEDKIAYVQQAPYIFNLPLADNLRFSGSGTDDRETQDVLRYLELDSLISEERKDKLLAENGQNISGGEALRVGLTRALLSDASIFLIDEPTSKLDEETEHKVIESILKLKKRGAVLIVSHSEKIKKASDRVIQLSFVKNRTNLAGAAAW